MNRLLIQTLPILLFITSILPQPIDLKNESLQSLYGPSPSCVRHIIKDRRGFMWFGTEFGLVRYDGYSFKIYDADLAKPNSLSHNEITAIYESQTDPDPILWIGTADGLNKFDLENEIFYHFSNNRDDSTTISNNYISSICEDQFGNLWIGTFEGGLNRFDQFHHTFTRFKHDPNDKNSIMNNKVWSLFFDDQQKLWIGAKGGVDLFNPDDETFTHYYAKKQDPNSLSSHHVTSILQDGEGVMWFGTGTGLNKLIHPGPDNLKPKFKSFLYDSENERSLSHNWIQDLLEDKKGRFYVGTYGNGIDIFDRETEQFYTYDECEARHVYRLYEDDEQNIIWVGTDIEGAFKLFEPRNNIKVFKRNPQEKNTLSDNYINTIYEDRQGNIWLATQNGGLNKFELRNNRFTHYKNDPADPHSIPTNRVTGICQDTSGLFWIATPMGLTSFNPKTEKFDYIVSADVECMQKDKVDPDALWLGTFGLGLLKYSIKQNSVEAYLNEYDNSKNRGDNSMTYIYSEQVNKKSIIWVGTLNNGVYRLFIENENLTHYTHDPNNRGSLISNLLTFLTF